jgi:hypothetical protein
VTDNIKTTAELIEEAKAKRANASHERIAKHNEAFDAAYLKALESASDEVVFIVVDIPNVGKTLHKFGEGAKHAEFKRHLNIPNKPVEMGPCKTYACHTVVFPDPFEFKKLCEKYNPQGFETAALKVARAMQPKDDAEGESSATDA